MTFRAGLLLTVVLAAAVAAPAALAQSPKPVEVRLACAQKGSGKLQFVRKASDCPTSRGTLVRFAQGFPVIVCMSNKSPRQLFLVNAASKCKAPKHPNTTALTLPASKDVKLCIGTGGTLRVVDKYSACKAAERRGVLKKLPNRTPVVDTSPGATSYTEGGLAKVIDAALTVSDANDTHLEGAAVRIAAGLQPGDVLAFANQLGISGSYNTGTGVLTLTGHATKAAYRTALRSVKFRTLNDDPTTSRTVGFRVSDGDVTSAPAAKRINITPVNDAPKLATTPGPLYYSEGDGLIAIQPSLALTDPDSANAQGAIVQITSGFVSADDQLTFTNQLGITGSYDPVAGRLTLTGIASTASYQTALRSVRYRNVSQNPAGTKTISVQVTDAGPPAPESNAATRTVNLIGDNDAAVVTTSSGSTGYDISDATPVAVDAALTVADVDDTNLEGAIVFFSAGFQAGDTLNFTDQSGITGSYNPSTAVLTLTGTASKADYQTALRSVTFSTTNGSPTPSKTVAFRVNDGDVDSNDASKDISLVQ